MSLRIGRNAQRSFHEFIFREFSWAWVLGGGSGLLITARALQQPPLCSQPQPSSSLLQGCDPWATPLLSFSAGKGDGAGWGGCEEPNKARFIPPCSHLHEQASSAATQAEHPTPSAGFLLQSDASSCSLWRAFHGETLLNLEALTVLVLHSQSVLRSDVHLLAGAEAELQLL